MKKLERHIWRGADKIVTILKEETAAAGGGGGGGGEAEEREADGEIEEVGEWYEREKKEIKFSVVFKNILMVKLLFFF